MDESYEDFVKRLTSSQMHVHRVPANVLTDLIHLALKRSDTIDAAKKALFYGKPNEYIEALVAMADVIDNQAYELMSVELVHAIIGIRTEADELLKLLLKKLTGKSVTRHDLIDETGDLLFYVQMLAAAPEVRMVMSEFMAANMRKLKARYPDGFSAERAMNPNREIEREAIDRDLT